MKTFLRARDSVKKVVSASVGSRVVWKSVARTNNVLTNAVDKYRNKCC